MEEAAARAAVVAELQEGLQEDGAPAIHGASSIDLAMSLARSHSPTVIVMDGSDSLHRILRLRRECEGARFVLICKRVGPEEESIVDQFEHVLGAMHFDPDDLDMIVGMAYAGLVANSSGRPTGGGRVMAPLGPNDSSGGNVGPV